MSDPKECYCMADDWKCAHCFEAIQGRLAEAEKSIAVGKQYKAVLESVKHRIGLVIGKRLDEMPKLNLKEAKEEFNFIYQVITKALAQLGVKP